jgi:hypothetical protein
MLRKVLIGCALVVLAGAAFVVVLLWYGSAQFKPLAVGILQQYNEGRVDRIYENASEQFKAQVPQEQLAAILKQIEERLGKFVEAGAVTGTATHVSTDVSTGEVSLKLKFEKGATTGEFKFVKNEDVWRLLGLSVDFQGIVQEGSQPTTESTPQ